MRDDGQFAVTLCFVSVDKFDDADLSCLVGCAGYGAEPRGIVARACSGNGGFACSNCPGRSGLLLCLGGALGNREFGFERALPRFGLRDRRASAVQIGNVTPIETVGP